MPVLINSHGFARQVTFGAAGAGAAAGTLVLNVPYPTGIVAGSSLILHVVTASTPITPAGWVEIGSIPGSAYAYRKSAVGDETGNLPVSLDAGANVFARMYRFSHGSGAESVGTASTLSGDTTIEAVNVTTLGQRRMAVQLMFAGANTTIGPISGESGADYTEAVAEFAGASPAPFVMSCQVAEVPLATAITGGSATLGADANVQNVIAFAIVP